MNQNTFYTQLNTLYYNSFLSSQAFKIDSKNNLQIIELSPFKNRNETIPLDLIDSEPKISKRLDGLLISFSLISIIVSAICILSVVYANQIWAISFAILFILISLATALASYRNKTTLYTYQFMGMNTHLFTLHESFSGDKQVEIFVHALNERISNVHTETTDMATAEEKIEENAEAKNDDQRSQFIKHLDFLYNHGVINDALYNRLDQKINEKIFGLTSESSLNNVIKFPTKAV